MDNSQEEFSKYKYSVKEPKDNSDDSLILKSGLEAEFTFNDIIKEIARLNKQKTELEAKKGLSSAFAQNVANHNDFVEKMPEKDRIAVFLYEKSKTEIKVVDETLKIINEQSDNYARELEEISKQTGIKIKCPEPENPKQ